MERFLKHLILSAHVHVSLKVASLTGGEREQNPGFGLNPHSTTGFRVLGPTPDLPRWEAGREPNPHPGPCAPSHLENRSVGALKDPSVRQKAGDK